LKKTCFNIKTSVKWGLPSFHCEFFYRNCYKYCIYKTKSNHIDQPLMWRVFLGDGSNMECLLGPTNLSHILSIQPNGIQSVLSQPCFKLLPSGNQRLQWKVLYTGGFRRVSIQLLYPLVN
jgi:hypothetical protein